MRILLCLLSGQHVPNLLSVHHFNPDRLVLIESEQMKGTSTAQRLLDALRAGGRDYEVGRNAYIEPLSHEDSLRDVLVTVKAAYGRFPSEDWIINVTGGTKPMSIGTFEFFRNLGETLVYVNNARPDTLLWMDGSREEVCSYRPSIKEWLLGYGFKTTKADKDIFVAEERARKWWDCAKVLAMHASPCDLVAWDEDDRREASKKGFELQPSHCLEPLKVSAVREKVASTFSSLRVADGALSGRVDKYVARFLCGIWLEVFFWGLLDRHQSELGLWDVRLGLEVVGEGGAPNEFDVTFMRRYNLSMIECKSGAQEHDKKAEILYKVEAVMQQFRALGIRKFLATTSGDVLTKDSEDVKPELARRASISQCSLLTYPKIRQLASNSDSPDAVRQVLELK